MDNRKKLMFPCPKCNADIWNFCVSKKGIEMERFVHPERGVLEGSLDSILALRDWLMNYGDIFREAA